MKGDFGFSREIIRRVEPQVGTYGSWSIPVSASPKSAFRKSRQVGVGTRRGVLESTWLVSRRLGQVPVSDRSQVMYERSIMNCFNGAVQKLVSVSGPDE
jgi:hypothetical protein